MTDLFSKLSVVGVSVGVLVLFGIGIYFVHQRLLALYADKPAAQYKRQLIMLAVALIGLVLAIVVMPIGDTMRGQLLSLLGILLSATIALSSTTIVGNAMAGLMMKILNSCKPGDYIRVGDYFGRVSEMDLLHTEIQSEERDLISLPNLYLATNPVTVLQSDGTVLSVELSLGYDIPHTQVEKLLLAAADKTGLEKPFVQITQLGDFSVTYRIAGMLTELKRLISTRRHLRVAVLDELHGAGVEIVSPNYVNQRVFDTDKHFVPEAAPLDSAPTEDMTREDPDEMVFDKAEQAELLQGMKDHLEELAQRISQREQRMKASTDKREMVGLRKEIEVLRKKQENTKSMIERAEMRMAKKVEKLV